MIELLESSKSRHAVCYKVRKFSNARKYDIAGRTVYTGAYATYFDSLTKASIVVTSLYPRLGLYCVWYTCSEDQETRAMKLLHTCTGQSMGMAIFAGSLIVADSERPTWHSHVKYMNHPGSLCTICISMRSIKPSARGEFIGGSGPYTHYYISGGLSYELNVKKNILEYAPIGDINWPLGSDIIVSAGYRASHIAGMEVVSCPSVDDWTVHTPDITEHLIRSNPCVKPPPKGHTGGGTVEVLYTSGFQSVRASDSRLLHRVDAIHHLMSSCMFSFARDTKQDIIFIYGPSTCVS